jgi:hypothetical protein
MTIARALNYLPVKTLEHSAGVVRQSADNRWIELRPALDSVAPQDAEELGQLLQPIAIRQDLRKLLDRWELTEK